MEKKFKKRKSMKAIVLSTIAMVLLIATVFVACQKAEQKQVNSSNEMTDKVGYLQDESDFFSIFEIDSDILSGLSESEIDELLQQIAKNLTNDVWKYEDVKFYDDWLYQDHYDMILTQFRSIRNVSREIYGRDLNELSSDEVLYVVDNHGADLLANAVSIAPSQKIADAVWGGWDSESKENESVKPYNFEYPYLSGSFSSPFLY